MGGRVADGPKFATGSTVVASRNGEFLDGCPGRKEKRDKDRNLYNIF